MAVASDDAGNMRPVSLVVVWGRSAVHEVDERCHPLIAVRIHRRRTTGEVVMPGGNPRIDHSDANTGAGQSETLLDGARAGRDR
jgi:hypothetical protein